MPGEGPNLVPAVHGRELGRSLQVELAGAARACPRVLQGWVSGSGRVLTTLLHGARLGLELERNMHASWANAREETFM